MKEIKFYDLKGKKSFNTNNYKFTTKGNPRTRKIVYFVVADAPSGIKSWKIVSKDFYMNNK